MVARLPCARGAAIDGRSKPGRRACGGVCAHGSGGERHRGPSMPIPALVAPPDPPYNGVSLRVAQAAESKGMRVHALRRRVRVAIVLFSEQSRRLGPCGRVVSGVLLLAVNVAGLCLQFRWTLYYDRGYNYTTMFQPCANLHQT